MWKKESPREEELIGTGCDMGLDYAECLREISGEG